MLWYLNNVEELQKKGFYMADLTISSIRERLFNPTKHEKSVARSSNPFAQTSFKGNVLTADVFVSENSKEKQDKISFTGKLKASALVGSLSNMSERWHNAIESVTAFANRIKNNVIGFWDKMSHTEVSFEPAKEAISKAGAKAMDSIQSMFEPGISAKNISKNQDMSALKNMLSENVQLWEATA